MTENERWDRVNRALAAVGLSIGGSGIRGTLAAWEKLIGYADKVSVGEVTPAEGTITITTTNETLCELAVEHSNRALSAKGGRGAVDSDRLDEANAWLIDKLISGGNVKEDN